jgi:hypothetical protein
MHFENKTRNISETEKALEDAKKKLMSLQIDTIGVKLDNVERSTFFQFFLLSSELLMIN